MESCLINGWIVLNFRRSFSTTKTGPGEKRRIINAIEHSIGEKKMSMPLLIMISIRRFIVDDAYLPIVFYGAFNPIKG